MSDDIDDDIDGGLGDEAPKKKFSGKKLVLFIVLPLLLIGGGGAAAFFTGMLDGLLGGGGEEEVAEGEAGDGEEGAPADGEAPPEEMVDEDGPGVFFDMPNMLVNLNVGGRQPRYLKMVISLELNNDSDLATVEQQLPRIVDQFQVYLRELRLEDLRGSAGMYRLREELILRVTTVAHPVRVRDVLFREILVQ